jgi:hypothetical protein
MRIRNVLIDATYRCFDLAMLAIANGKERDLEDWQNLLTRVDTRLKISNVIQPFGSAMGLIEARLVDE